MLFAHYATDETNLLQRKSKEKKANMCVYILAINKVHWGIFRIFERGVEERKRTAVLVVQRFEFFFFYNLTWCILQQLAEICHDSPDM